MTETVTKIAIIAHEVNRAYCQSIGDHSQLSWYEAPQWQRDSAIAGVRFHLANPDATPADSHACWLMIKEAEGWVFGPKKDPVLKTHPCVLPYGELPQAQRSKDYLFRSVVHAVAKELNDD